MQLFDERAEVVGNIQLSERIYLMGIYAPQTANSIKPGQFVHITVDNTTGHILRRPFSVMAADPETGIIDILYQVVGSLTEVMTAWEEGHVLSMISPIGRGWRYPAGTEHALLVGGGIGAAPLFMLCKDLVSRGIRTDVVLGAVTADALVCRARYESLASDILRLSYATDDGTLGRAGFCTSLVEDALAAMELSDVSYDYIAVCGPEPLMRSVANMAEAANVFCEASLERRMACGVGACLSCIVETRGGRRRACVDGPVFETKEILW